MQNASPLKKPIVQFRQWVWRLYERGRCLPLFHGHAVQMHADLRGVTCC